MDVIALYNTHKNMVYHLALSYTKSRQDAEDITQQAFIRLLENQDKINPGKEKFWLATVTVNLCKNLLRSAWRSKTEPLSEELFFEHPEQSEIFWAVMALNETERAVVLLYYYEGYSTRETAKILGISNTAVTTRLNRARKHLKGKLEEVQYG